MSGKGWWTRGESSRTCCEHRSSQQSKVRLTICWCGGLWSGRSSSNSSTRSSSNRSNNSSSGSGNVDRCRRAWTLVKRTCCTARAVCAGSCSPRGSNRMRQHITRITNSSAGL
ncbi:unnamed protein product [Closterium sp. NIES-53]